VAIAVLEFDDDEASALTVALEQAGFRVSTADPEDAAIGNTVDAVIVGSARPRDRTLELFKQLRASGYGGAIVALGAGAGTDGVVYLEQGADDYLPQPVRAPELVARVRAVLRRVTGHSRLERGPLTIDRNRRVAHVRGRRLALTAREYSLLLELAEAEGRTLTRMDLMMAVWGSQSEGGSNLVQVNLSRLRDKLGPDASLVETVRRGGYRLRW
jgi:two-component system, OmpR family, response regulator